MNDDRFSRLESKVDVIVEKIHSIDKTLERNTASLELHIRRTDILEESMVPIKAHVTLMNNLAKIIIFAGILAAIYHNLK